ncbi:MAG: N-acetylglucosamine kinase [bacterium]|jgi:glucosamine kinase
MTGLKLIADSGATKTEWRIIGIGRHRSFFTTGISPYHMDQSQIEKVILSEFPTSVFKKKLASIHYYGTGCYTKPKAKIVQQALRAVFPSVQINIGHDLMGAAIALCGDQKGIACILGTGSNSCLYNGKRIVSNSPGLGYVLGDEGSGAYLGKKVIQHVLYGIFDKELMDAFIETYKTDKAEILHRVYKEPFANRYLAGFSKFLADHRGHYMIENIIEDGLGDFFNQHLETYAQRYALPVHFVGSIAFYYKDKIADLCRSYGYSIGKVIKQPMDGLVEYHKLG